MKNRRNKNYRDPNFTPISNEAFSDAMRDLRRSNAATRHLSSEQKMTKSHAKHRAINEQLM